MSEPKTLQPLTPLAEEILADLRPHFPNGATRTELAEWLGGSKTDIVAALTELLRCERIVKASSVYRAARQLELRAA